MGIDNANAFYTAQITLQRKSSPFDRTFITLSNRPVRGEPSEYIPLIKSISNIGSLLDEYLPRDITANLAIDNSVSSLANTHKFSDLLDEWTVSNQDIVIRSAFIPTDEDVITGSTNNVFSGKIQSFEYRNNNQEISLRLRSSINDSRQLITYELNNTDFPTLPNQSAGRYLPIVVGRGAQVNPYIVETQGSFRRFAYASTLGTQFENQGLARLLVANINRRNDEEKEYFQVSNGLDSVLGGSDNLSRPDIGASGNGDLPLTRQWFFPLHLDSTKNSILINSGAFQIRTNGGTATQIDGDIIIGIHGSTRRNRPRTEYLARAVLSKQSIQDVTALNLYQDTVATENIAFVLDRIVPIVFSKDPDPDRAYFISITATEEEVGTVNETFIRTSPYNGGIHNRSFSTPDTENEGTERALRRRDVQSGRFIITPVEITDNPNTLSVNADGLGYSSFDFDRAIARPNIFDNAIEDDPLNTEDLDLIAEVDGLTDNANGDITGIPNNILQTPFEQIQALFYKYDGANWNPTNFDSNFIPNINDAYLTGNFPRVTNGATRGETYNIDLIRELCRNSASRLGYIRKTGSFGLYAQGEARPVVRRLSDADINFEQYFIQDLTSIINFQRVAWFPRLDLITSLDQDLQREFRGYRGFSRRESSTTAIYGRKELSNNTFDFINFSAHISQLMRIVQDRNEDPGEYIQFTVPYQKYQDLDLLDVLEIDTIHLPYDRGTNAKQAEFNVNNWQRVLGFGQSKLKRYRVQIEGITESIPELAIGELRILARLILRNDPT